MPPFGVGYPLVTYYFNAPIVEGHIGMIVIPINELVRICKTKHAPLSEFHISPSTFIVTPHSRSYERRNGVAPTLPTF